ncbi:hypothetical protein evm_014700 [Chilo suppressalis]|nr:hypothetical protein evm_014700 [Chilo suppressalis]
MQKTLISFKAKAYPMSSKLDTSIQPDAEDLSSSEQTKKPKKKNEFESETSADECDTDNEMTFIRNPNGRESKHYSVDFSAGNMSLLGALDVDESDSENENGLMDKLATAFGHLFNDDSSGDDDQSNDEDSSAPEQTEVDATDNEDNDKAVSFTDGDHKIKKDAEHKTVTLQVLNKNQHGFREKHSTTSAVLDCSFEILNALNENKCAVSYAFEISMNTTFMDISKAYDRVLHEVLLKKLEQLGSIPQGSVLGCLMFLAYINDLSRATAHKVVQFAEDATLIISGDYNDINTLRDEITSSINKIAKHLREIGLELNLEKKILQFRPHQRLVLPLNVTFEHNEIEVVDTFVTLGITMDSTLSWKPHVSTVVSKLSSFTYALYELRKCTNAQCALTAYHAHAAAWIRYGIVF